MSGEHARLSCSGAVRWVPCPGSLTLEEQFPENGPTEESLEGDAAHEVLATHATLGSGVMVLNDMASNGVIVTQEMIDGAELLINDIDKVCGDDPEVVLGLMIEQRVVSDVIHTENWGTPDAWLFMWRTMTLYLWDYKFGHEFVDVFGNFQFLDYVALILATLEVNGYDDQQITVVMRVVQPRYYSRGGPIREWVVKASELRGYWNQMRASADEALGPNPRTITGNHCTHCRGRHACKALKNSAMASIDYIDNASPELLDNQNIGIEYNMLLLAQARVKSRVLAIAADIEARVKGGQDVIGWGIESTYGNKKWLVDAQEIAILGDLNGVEFRKPLEVCTPTQALAKKGMSNDILKEYYDTPFTGLKLVQQTEASIAAVFTKVD